MNKNTNSADVRYLTRIAGKSLVSAQCVSKCQVPGSLLFGSRPYMLYRLDSDIEALGTL